jgi:uncharacterized phage-associated protein
MKLQKMLYFAQGVHLVLNDRRPLFDDKFQAWKYGPVIPSIYQEYKLFGSQPILDTELLRLFGSDFPVSDVLDASAEKTVEITWNNTKDIDAGKLSNWTHLEGSPWFKYYQEGINDIIIPNEEIANYFTQFLVKKGEK